MGTASTPLGNNHNMGVRKPESYLKSPQSAADKNGGSVAHHTRNPQNHIVMCNLSANKDRTQVLRPQERAPNQSKKCGIIDVHIR